MDLELDWIQTYLAERGPGARGHRYPNEFRLTPHLRIWAYPAPCDMRKGHNGLLGLIERQMCRDVLSGDLFLFVNRGFNLTKILYFDGTGYVILYKRRLEGRFPRLWDRDVVDATGIRLTAAELALFLDGCQLLSKRSVA